jgi:four helix bundle protein
MRVESVEELEVWQLAWRFVEAVSAQTRGGGLSRDLRLRDQIDACADSLLSNMSEGFEQGTDRGFARYLYIARGSCAEARAHLAVAQLRRHVAAETADGLRRDADQIVRMLTGLIDYLLQSDRKRRR